MKQSLHTNQSITALDADDPAVQISALFDGELSAGDALQDLSAYKRDWDVYALIGESLSQSPTTAAMQAPSAEFSRRLAAALEREPGHKSPVQALRQPSKTQTRRTQWLLGPAWQWLRRSLLWLGRTAIIYRGTVRPVATAAPAVTSGVAVSDYTNAHRHFSGPLAVRQASFEPEARK